MLHMSEFLWLSSIFYLARFASGFVTSSTSLSATGWQACSSEGFIAQPRVHAVCTTTMSTSNQPTSTVLVAGAGGRTGGIVFDKLVGREGYVARAMVRSEKSADKLRKTEKVTEDNVVVADVTDPPSLKNAFEGVDQVILCTSAVPKIYPLSIVRLLVKKLLRFKNPGRPKFYFGEKGTPEEVDWIGAKALIDEAKKVGVKHFVYIGSMGGTQPDNFLNTIGKKEDGTGGDILLWKRCLFLSPSSESSGTS